MRIESLQIFRSNSRDRGAPTASMPAKSDQRRPAVDSAVLMTCFLARDGVNAFPFEQSICLVDRAEPASLPKTSLKSDQARAKVVRAQRAFAHLGEVR